MVVFGHEDSWTENPPLLLPLRHRRNPHPRRRRLRHRPDHLVTRQLRGIAICHGLIYAALLIIFLGNAGILVE